MYFHWQQDHLKSTPQPLTNLQHPPYMCICTDIMYFYWFLQLGGPALLKSLLIKVSS